MIGDGAGGVKLICRVCQKQYANYTCPRCNLRYCSLPCYKKHSVRCTESFMRDNVVEEMKNVHVSSDSKRKMLEALQRVYSDETAIDSDVAEESDANETILSDETLQKVLTGGDVTLEDLTFSEQSAFRRAVAAGELSHLIHPWEPWWLKPEAKSISLSKQGTSLVQAVTTPSSSVETQLDFPLPPAEPLPALSHLSRAEPSPLLPVHVVEIIYSYCFVLRLYNGDWKDSSTDAVTDVLSISKVLSQSAQPETVSEALSYCLEVVCSLEFKHAGGYELGVRLCDDTSSFLRAGKGVVICALADLQRLLECSIKESKLSGSSGGKGRHSLQVASRKVFYLLCWTNALGDSLPSFAALVDAEKRRLAETRAQQTLPPSTSKCVIEEL